MTSNSHQDICKICRRQVSRYTCPGCNLPYCSLTCFRSPVHTDCSEAFYKRQIEDDIRSEPSKSAEERLKMMELLKRFEEENLDDLPQEDDSDEEDTDDLARRFEGIDVESASPDALWSKLSPDEQATFMKALQDPASELAQELLVSEELQKDEREPWWEASPSLIDDSRVDNDLRYGTKPEHIPIPSTMVKPVPVGPPLIYNLCVICIAYAFITRRLATSPLHPLQPADPDRDEAKRLISQLVPFLTDRKSTTLHTDLSSVIADTWSRFDKSTISSSTLSVLMRDCATLLRPLPVGLISQASTPSSGNDAVDTFDTSSHPNRKPVHVLSDLHRLYNYNSPEANTNVDGLQSKKSISNPISEPKSKSSQVAHKLLYYAAHILSTPPLVLNSLSNDLVSFAVRAEAEASASAGESAGTTLVQSGSAATTSSPTRGADVPVTLRPANESLVEGIRSAKHDGNREQVSHRDQAEAKVSLIEEL